MPSTSFPLFIVDAFTTEPFRGNPAAVVVLPAAEELHATTTSTSHPWALSDSQMLRIATEMNLSETVFLSPLPKSEVAAGVAKEEESVHFGIRWFTPQMEVGLCGHATLAASHVLFAEFFSLLPEHFQRDGGNVATSLPTIQFFNAQSGWLSVSRHSPPSMGIANAAAAATGVTPPLYGINFPLRTPQRFSVFDVAPPQCFDELCAALNLTPSDVRDVQLHRGSRKYLLVLRSAEAVTQRAKLDVPRLRRAFELLKDSLTLLGEQEQKEFVEPLSVTITADARTAAAPASEHIPFPLPTQQNVKEEESSFVEVVSRHFAPWVGIDEDPVTGAAHVVLVPYWIREKYFSHEQCDTAAQEGELDEKMVGKSLRCMQASARGGYLYCTVEQGRRLRLQGSAVTFLRGNATVQ